VIPPNRLTASSKRALFASRSADCDPDDSTFPATV